MKATFEKCYVTLDGSDESFECWSNGELWNGWTRAHFERADAERVLEYFEEYRPVLDVQFTDAGISFKFLDDGTEETWPHSTIETPDGPREVFLADGWCFYEPEDEPHTCDDECRSHGCQARY